VKTGAVDYLLKPQSIAQIEEAIHRALKRRFVQYQRQHLIDIFEDAMDTLQAVDSLPSQRVSKPSGLSGSIEMNGMLFNPEQRTFITYMGATNTQQPVMRTTELTAHQCAILSYMVLNPHKVLSSLEISSKALGYHNLTNTEADRIIRPHILKLRRKIEANPSNPRLILSVRGKGYLFSPP
jgi:DNA-binding response OmpR family regulator